MRGSSTSGMATTPVPRFCNVIGVAATSISSRSSPARISRDWPDFKLSAWRSDLGTTRGGTGSRRSFWHIHRRVLSRELAVPSRIAGDHLAMTLIGPQAASGHRRLPKTLTRVLSNLQSVGVQPVIRRCVSQLEWRLRLGRTCSTDSTHQANGLRIGRRSQIRRQFGRLSGVRAND
jgi:hypothetical protein